MLYYLASLTEHCLREALLSSWQQAERRVFGVVVVFDSILLLQGPEAEAYSADLMTASPASRQSLSLANTILFYMRSINNAN